MITAETVELEKTIRRATYKMGIFGCLIKDGTLDIQHMFFVHKKICFSDIGKVTAGSKGELYLYDLGGKRLIKAGGLVGNFGLLEDDLGRFGKIGVGKTCKDQK